METKKALITGITGQDGTYLSEFLIGKGYEVDGIIRRVVGREPETTQYLKNRGIGVIEADIRGHESMFDIVSSGEYDEIYHLAAQSDVGYSFRHPHETYDINIMGTQNLLDALRYSEYTKFYFAGTSELFGQPDTVPQTENTPMRPRSPYAVSKLAGYWTAKQYREAHNLFVSCGILFNHESPIRGPNFVTRKITKAMAEYHNTGKSFQLGNINARKDWGYAPEYVEGMWRMLQYDEPEDFILATNERHTVREFLEETCRVLDIETRWIHTTDGVDILVDDDNAGRTIVTTDQSLFRPTEADNYQGDYTKAWQLLGWKPETTFKELIEKMILNDLYPDGR